MEGGLIHIPTSSKGVVRKEGYCVCHLDQKEGQSMSPTFSEERKLEVELTSLI